MNGLQQNEVTDGYAIGVTLLVALTARPAIGVHEVCRRMLRFPERSDRWEPPGVPDSTAGEWPADVVSKLVEVVVGTSLEHFKEDRMLLTEALASLEAIVEEAADEAAVEDEAPPHVDALPEARVCTICLDNDREVRFACGHCVA